MFFPSFFRFLPHLPLSGIVSPVKITLFLFVHRILALRPHRFIAVPYTGIQDVPQDLRILDHRQLLKFLTAARHHHGQYGLYLLVKIRVFKSSFQGIIAVLLNVLLDILISIQGPMKASR